MVNHIDVRSVLRKTVCELYSNLVTRPTGVAVRSGIEQQISQLDVPSITVIDFSHVNLLDFSCADEIVAKLLLQYASSEAGEGAPRDVYFVFRGISESHLHAIETVLERYGLALVNDEGGGSLRLVGDLDAAHRLAWEAIFRLGWAVAEDVASAVGVEQDQAIELVEDLWRRRLVIRRDDGYVAVGANA